MNVLSLFDGMSCGRIALDRLGIPVDKYYASEIDKYAIQVSEANYPDIIRLGDVCDVKAEDLAPIDLLIAGSPCQGFSFAGKQLAFDDPRSALFFEFVRLLKECKPKYFLLENVRMKKEFLDIISEQVGCEPIFINSALVSAQNRQRYYWTNIPGIEQPEQRGIVLRDILETTPADPTLMSDSFVARQKKNINGKCLVDQNKEKAASLSAMEYVKNGRQGDYLACDDEGVPQDNPSEFDKNLDKMTNKDGKAYCVTARYTAAEPENSMQRKQRTMVPVMKDNLESLPLKSQTIKSQYAKSSKANFERSGTYHATGIPQTTHDTPKQVGTAVDINGHDVLKRVYSPDGKAPTVNTCQGGNREPKVLVDVRAMTEVRSPEANQIRYAHKKKTGKDWSPRHMRHLVERDDEKMNTLTGALTKQHILKITEKEAKGGRMVGRAYDKEGKRMDRDGTSVAGLTTQMLELRKDDKSNAITTVGKDSLVVKSHARAYNRNDGLGEKLEKSFALNASDWRGLNRNQNQNAVVAENKNEVYWRKLTPVECERLQTVPDNYTNCVSNTQRYKMLGNGWTIETICHIFKNMQLIEDGKDIPRATGQQTLDF